MEILGSVVLSLCNPLPAPVIVMVSLAASLTMTQQISTAPSLREMTTGFRDLGDGINISLQMEKRRYNTQIFNKRKSFQILTIVRYSHVQAGVCLSNHYFFSWPCQIIFEICEILPAMTSFLSLEIVCPSYI